MICLKYAVGTATIAINRVAIVAFLNPIMNDAITADVQILTGREVIVFGHFQGKALRRMALAAHDVRAYRHRASASASWS